MMRATATTLPKVLSLRLAASRWLVRLVQAPLAEFVLLTGVSMDFVSEAELNALRRQVEQLADRLMHALDQIAVLRSQGVSATVVAAAGRAAAESAADIAAADAGRWVVGGFQPVCGFQPVIFGGFQPVCG